jgi:hypothetical protein
MKAPLRLQIVARLALGSVLILAVLAFSARSDGLSPHRLQALAGQAELERLCVSDFVEVSCEGDTSRLDGHLYVYRTVQGERLLWVNADGSHARILGAGPGGLDEFIVTDLDGDGNGELAFVENHGSGLFIGRVVGYRVGEWASAPAFAAYVSHGPVPIHLRVVQNPSRLEVLCGDEPLGWFQFDHSLGSFIYYESDLALPNCALDLDSADGSKQRE